MRPVFYRKCALLLLMLLVVPAWAAPGFSGKVVGISDGDTIRVLRDGREIKIRLHGMMRRRATKRSVPARGSSPARPCSAEWFRSNLEMLARTATDA